MAATATAIISSYHFIRGEDFSELRYAVEKFPQAQRKAWLQGKMLTGQRPNAG